MKNTIIYGHFNNMSDFYIVYKEFNHYTLYINGNFFCTGDSRREIEDKLDEYLKKRG